MAKYANSSDPTHYIADVPTRTLAASVDNMDKNMANLHHSKVGPIEELLA